MDHILVSKHEILDEEKNLLVNSCGNPTPRIQSLIIICVSFLFGFSGNLSSNVYSLFITSYDPVYRVGPL